MRSNRFLIHFSVWSLCSLWFWGTLDLHRLRRATLAPGRPLYRGLASSNHVLHNQYLHAAVKIHTVDTNSRVVLDAKIDMFANAKTKVASIREISLSQFIFLDFEATLEDFFSLRTSNCNMDSNLFVTTNTEGSNRVASLAY